MLEKKVIEAFPEVNEIKDEELRKKVIKTWVMAMEKGGWTELKGIPYTLVIETKREFIEHTRTVTKTAMAAAFARGDLNMDHVIAAALLHDVGKLLEFTRKGGKVVKSSYGKMVRHPVSGGILATEAGLPDEIVHAIVAHSKEGDAVKRTPLAVLIHHCDFIDFETDKARR